MTTPPARLWIALVADTQAGDQVQACTSRDAALHWVASTIPADDWAQFYDTLSPGDRTGLARDKDANAPLALIEGWAGPRDETTDTWGNDMYLITLTEQVPYSGPNPAAQEARSDADRRGLESLTQMLADEDLHPDGASDTRERDRAAALAAQHQQIRDLLARS